MKGRFTASPFGDLELTLAAMDELLDVSKMLVDANLERYEQFSTTDNRKVDPTRWKPVKSKEGACVYMQREPEGSRRTSRSKSVTSDLQSLLCVGTTGGTIDDVMFGAVNPTLEAMRVKASYVDDLSGAAVLSTIVEPTLDDPFRSSAVKWMELDLPLQSLGLAKPRDYVYVESTGIEYLSNGEQVGYHLMHSVEFPQTHDMPGRVRAKLSNCAFFRQIRRKTVGIYVMGMLDTMSDRNRGLVVSSMIKAFLSTLKYAHCGEMKKLALVLDDRYAELKANGPPNPERICVTCAKSLRPRRFGTFEKTRSTCKICFGFVCRTCKVTKKLHFVTPELLVTHRKVSFCASCLITTMTASASDVAKVAIQSGNSDAVKLPQRSMWSTWGTMLEASANTASYDFANTR
ncbi:hypothetical protein BBJ28_00000445 [Nothophytophthora sp. Chile5]|nr:hypothetical protein BBJ28_00000445 [Nothophytophthora sp. Chile5]